ncbi:hypothetical protein I79_019172 [Cricetulus griseus]|uniref:Uncharacterized protein n=1 Tax=Cricetulus griseus TaxID=10029 RepID=G3I6P5_CRIGR|nr:hypothetical protein I79_019172 [Cricetulus griseus]
MADESPTPPTPNLSFDAEQMEKHCPPPSPTHTSSGPLHVSATPRPQLSPIRVYRV